MSGIYEVRRSPEEGHTRACLAKAIIAAIENLRDEEGTNDHYFRLAMQDNYALQLADEYLAEGMTECLCPAGTSDFAIAARAQRIADRIEAGT